LMDRGDSQSDGQVGLAGTSAADQDQVVGFLGEFAVGQRLDELALDVGFLPLEIRPPDRYRTGVRCEVAYTVLVSLEDFKRLPRESSIS
jgi:hypothetical protein